MAVQDLDLEIKHRPGKSNSNADALSRNPVGNAVVLLVQAEVAEEDQPAMASEVKHLQRDDAECKAMLAYLEEGVLPENSVLARKITLERPHFEIIDGCIMKIPTDLVNGVLLYQRRRDHVFCVKLMAGGLQATLERKEFMIC